REPPARTAPPVPSGSGAVACAPLVCWPLMPVRWPVQGEGPRWKTPPTPPPGPAGRPARQRRGPRPQPAHPLLTREKPMKLYRVHRLDFSGAGYDEAEEFVVAAKDEDEAREFASA